MKSRKEEVDSHLEETKYWGPSNNTVFAIHEVNDYKRRALDLGCGSFRNSKFLLNCGFIIDAIDNDPRVKGYADNIIKSNIFCLRGKGKKIFNLKIANYLNSDFGKEKYEVVIAENSLSFNRKRDVKRVISKIYVSLRSGGCFGGNLFGLNDYRYSKNNMSFYTKKEAELLLNKFKVKWFDEQEGDGKLGGKDFHWHAFEFVVQKDGSKI